MSIANMSMRAKYAEAIVMFLRLKEKEVGPTAIHLKVIAENVINMVGLTIEEKAKVTANRENPSAGGWAADRSCACYGCHRHPSTPSRDGS